MSCCRKTPPPAAGGGAAAPGACVAPCPLADPPGGESKTKNNEIDIVFDPSKSSKVKKCERIVHVQFLKREVDGAAITGAKFSPAFAHEDDATTSTDGWTVDSLAGETTPDYQQGKGDGKKNGGSTKAKIWDAPKTSGGDAGFYDPVTKKTGTKKVVYKFVSYAYCMKGDDCGKWYEGVEWEYVKTWEEHRDGKIGSSKITNNNVTAAPTAGQIDAFDKFNKKNGHTPCK